MKNDSFFFPFDLPGDGLFDSDNDGQLTGFETAFRDAVIMTALDYLLGEDKEESPDEYEDFDEFDEFNFDGFDDE